MSASASKKRRQQSAAVAEPKKDPEQVKKTKKIILRVVAAVVAVAIVVGAAFLLNALKYGKPVMTVGEYKIKAPAFQYAYVNNANYMLQMDSFYQSIYSQSGQDYTPSVQTGVSFGSQYYGDEGQTLEEYLIAATKESLISAYNFYDAAVKDNYQLTDEDKTSIEENVQQIKDAAKEAGISVNKYLQNYVGAGCSACNLSNYEDYLNITTIASSYSTYMSEKLAGEITTDEIDARYNEDTGAYDYAIYDLYTVNPELGEEEETYSAEALDAAKAKAEAAVTAFPEDEASLNKYGSHSSAVTAVSEEAADWMFTNPAEGEIKLFDNAAEDGEATTWWVVRFKRIDTNDYLARSASVLSLAFDTEEGSTANKDIFDAVCAGISGNMTEEDFAAVLDGQGQSASSYQVLRVSTSYPEEVVSWIYEGKEGDVKTFTLNDKYYVVRISAIAEETYRNTTIRSNLADEKTSDWETSTSEIYTVEKGTVTVNDDQIAKANFTNLTYGSSNEG